MTITKAETAAFNDLTKKQQAKYLKEHPDSKFNSNSAEVHHHLDSAREAIDNGIYHGRKHKLLSENPVANRSRINFHARYMHDYSDKASSHLTHAQFKAGGTSNMDASTKAKHDEVVAHNGKLNSHIRRVYKFGTKK